MSIIVVCGNDDELCVVSMIKFIMMMMIKLVSKIGQYFNQFMDSVYDVYYL
jgi:hypothetical protein